MLLATISYRSPLGGWERYQEVEKSMEVFRVLFRFNSIPKYIRSCYKNLKMQKICPQSIETPKSQNPPPKICCGDAPGEGDDRYADGSLDN